METYAGERCRAFLSTAPAGRGEKRLALAVVLVSVIVFAMAAPFARSPLAPVPAFIPAYEAALAINDLITAVLLFGQFAQLRSRALLALAAGYLFDAALIVPHALTFPGVFSPGGLLGAGEQTTAWLYVFWHGGFPLFVLAYALLSRRGEVPNALNGGIWPAIFTVSVGVVAIAIALTALATAGQNLLPTVMRNGDYSLVVQKGISPAIWAFSLVALLALWRRRRTATVLDVWLMVVMAAWLLDVALSAVIGSSRYDLGWYAGRTYGLLASSFVLIVLLVETKQLYGRLAGALDESERRHADLVRSREELARAQRLEAIGQLTGGVAHDFNNLLTVITGNLDLILRTPGDATKVRRLAQVAMNATARGEKLTQQLLTFARRQVTRPETVNPNRLIADLTTFLSRAVGESIEIATSLSPVLDPARLDPAQFEAAILNLVVNARDAMVGGGRVTIETANIVLDADYVAHNSEATRGPYVMVAVSDTGTGMPPDVAAKAFDPFFTTKEVGKGSGLGLSQVYGFAKSAGGHVRIYTELGVGTTVKLYLPKSAEHPSQAETRADIAHLRPAKGCETILVVEDDADVLGIAVEGLVDLGYRVITAMHAAEALEILRGNDDIDLLFSDVIMPGGMNGAQLAVEARRLRPRLKVLLTSGYTASTLTLEHGLPENLEVLGKPYRREDLASKLRLVIDRG